MALAVTLVPGRSGAATAIREWIKPVGQYPHSADDYMLGSAFGSDGTSYALINPDQNWGVVITTPGGSQSRINLNGLSDAAYLYAIAVDPSGNPVVGGYLYDSTSGDYFFYVAKFDRSGNKIWESSYDYSNDDDEIYGLTVDGAGNVWGTGYTYNGSNSDVPVIEFDANGNFVNVTSVDFFGDYDYGYAISTDASGNAYVTGEADNNPLSGNTDSYAMQFGPGVSGPTWAQAYEVSSCGGDFGRGIRLSPSDGKVYLVSDDDDNCGEMDVLQIDGSNGNLLNSVSYPGYNAIAGGLALDGAGNIFVSFFDDPVTDDDLMVMGYDSSFNPLGGYPVAWDSGHNDGDDWNWTAQSWLASVGGQVILSGQLNTDNCGNGEDVGVRAYSGTSPAWSAVYDGPGTPFSQVAATDASDNVYAAGGVGNNLVITKHDRNGGLLYVNGGSCPSLCSVYNVKMTVANGVVYAAGLGYDSGTNKTTPVLCRFDAASGSFLGSTILPPVAPYGNWYMGGVAVDGLGNVYVATSFYNGNYLLDVYEADGAGNNLGSSGGLSSVPPYDIAAGIAVDGSGNLHCAEVSYGPYPYKMTDVKVSPALAKLAAYSFVIPSWGAYTQGIAYGNGSLVLCGYGYPSGARIALAKFSPTGVLAWSGYKTIPGRTSEYSFGVAMNPAGNIFVTGQSYNSLSGNWDFTVASFDSTGAARWDDEFNRSTGGNGAYGYGVATGSIYAVGWDGHESSVVRYAEPAVLKASATALPATVKQGRTITLAMTVTNSGGSAGNLNAAVDASPSPASGASLIAGPGPVVVPANGGAVTEFWTYEATGLGTVSFFPVVTGTDDDTGIALSATATAGPVTVTPGAALHLDLATSSDLPKAGTSVTVTMTVTDTGSVSASNVGPSLWLSDSSVATIASGPTPVPPQTLAAGQTVAYAWTLNVLKAGQVTITGSVTGTDTSDSSQIGHQTSLLLHTREDYGQSVVVFPNPVSGGGANLALNLKGDADEVTVEVYNMALKRVFEGKWNSVAKSDGTVTIDGAGRWAPGGYLVKVLVKYADGTTATLGPSKLVVRP